jgi:hypothetical protein
MSLKMVAIPFLAAGAALAMFKLVSIRRMPAHSLSRMTRPRVSAEAGPAGRLAGAAGVLSEQDRPKPSVLPIAFWDAASEQIEAEDVPPTARVMASRGTYDSLDPEDLGLEWLSRATESFDVRSTLSEDDPAEMPADSMSMISEASRFAASSAAYDPPSERADELGPDSSLLEPEDNAPRSDRG